MLDSFFNYLSFEKRYSIHTVSAYKTDVLQFEQYLLKEFGLEDVLKVEYAHVRSWLISLNTAQLSTKSLHRKMASIRSFYKFMLRQKAIPLDPTLKIKVPKLKKRLPVFATSSDMNRLLDAVVEHKEDNPFVAIRNQLIIELFYGTGIRLSELIGLKHQDIDFSKQSIKVTGKGNKQRLVPLHLQLISLMNQYIDEKKNTFPNNNNDSFIVTDKGLKCYPIFIYRIVKNKLSHINTLEKNSPHVLRHTFATHLLDKGAELNAIKELLGHSSLAATQVYTHNTPAKLKAIFEQAHPKGKLEN
ncbi:MAG: integrase [Cytophagales bacterium]|nr:MAG: integrase [Cytophagales bacterium]